MKAIYFVALLLGIGCTFAKGANLNCSNFPVELSGRLELFMKLYWRPTWYMHMPFNLNLTLQRFQTDMKINNKGPFNVIIDYNKRIKYIITNKKCHQMKTKERLPSAEDLKRLKLIASGKLGMKGADVGLYGYRKGAKSGLITIESGNMCITESFTAKFRGGTMVGSYFDLKTTIDSSKLDIPEMCKKKNGRRSLPAMKKEPWNLEIPLFF